MKTVLKSFSCRRACSAPLTNLATKVLLREVLVVKRAPRQDRSFYRREASLGLIERLIGQTAGVNYVVCESSQDVERAKPRGPENLPRKS